MKATTGTSRSTLPPLPHERDEAVEAPALPTKPMRLAAEDVESGQVDTDCRGATPARECDRDLPALLKPAQHPRD